MSKLSDVEIAKIKEEYPEYFAIPKHQRRALVSINYFRVINGKKEIPVPIQDKYYHRYFNKECYNRIDKNRCRAFSNKLRTKEEMDAKILEYRIKNKSEKLNPTEEKKEPNNKYIEPKKRRVVNVKKTIEDENIPSLF